MIYEISVLIIADDIDRAHETAVEIAEARGSEILEVGAEQIKIEGVDPEPTDGFALRVRMTPGAAKPVKRTNRKHTP